MDMILSKPCSIPKLRALIETILLAQDMADADHTGTVNTQCTTNSAGDHEYHSDQQGLSRLRLGHHNSHGQHLASLVTNSSERAEIVPGLTLSPSRKGSANAHFGAGGAVGSGGAGRKDDAAGVANASIKPPVALAQAIMRRITSVPSLNNVQEVAQHAAAAAAVAPAAAATTSNCLPTQTSADTTTTAARSVDRVNGCPSAARGGETSRGTRSKGDRPTVGAGGGGAGPSRLAVTSTRDATTRERRERDGAESGGGGSGGGGGGGGSISLTPTKRKNAASVAAGAAGGGGGGAGGGGDSSADLDEPVPLPHKIPDRRRMSAAYAAAAAASNCLPIQTSADITAAAAASGGTQRKEEHVKK